MENDVGNDSRTVERHQARFSGVGGNTPSLEATRSTERALGRLGE